MLLTHLLTVLTEKLESDANRITLTRLENALAYSHTVSTWQEIHDTDDTLHRRAAKSTDLLNHSLRNLSSYDIDKVSEAIGYPDPFEYFDEKTWALLHIACQKNKTTERCIYARLYAWLCHNPHSTQAMQARLFLMSQSIFDLTKAGADIIIEPILTTNDSWALLALLSSRDFTLEEYHNHFTTLRERAIIIAQTQAEHPYTNMHKDEAKSTLWAFVRYSGIEAQATGRLLKNIVTLLQSGTTEKSMPSFSQQDIVTLIKISSKSDHLNENIIHFLSALAVELFKNWNFEISSEEEESFNKPEQKFLNIVNSIKEKIRLDNSGRSAEEIIYTDFKDDWQIIRNVGVRMINPQMAPWIPSTPETEASSLLIQDIAIVWRKILDDQENILEKMYRDGIVKSREAARKKKAEDVSRQLLAIISTPGMFDCLVDLDSEKTIWRIINTALNTTHNVFFASVFYGLWSPQQGYQRTCGKDAVNWLLELDAFKNLRFLDHSDHKKYLETIFEANDTYFIGKVFPLTIDISTETRNPSLFASITQLAYLTDNKKIAKYFLKCSDFEILNHYPSSSETFQQLACVKTAYQLACIFYGEKTPDFDKGSFDEDILFAELEHRYKEMLPAMVEASNKTNDKTFIEITYKKIEQLFKLIKYASREQQHLFYANPVLVEFLLTYRINTKNPTSKKRLLLECIKIFAPYSYELPTDYCFLQLCYLYCFAINRDNEKNLHAIFQRIFSTQSLAESQGAIKLFMATLSNPTLPSMTTIDTWLKKEILNRSESKTMETLSLLPEDLLSKIFQDSDCLTTVVEGCKTHESQHESHESDGSDKESYSIEHSLASNDSVKSSGHSSTDNISKILRSAFASIPVPTLFSKSDDSRTASDTSTKQNSR